MSKSGRSNSLQSKVARSLLAVAIWGFAAFPLASTTFAATRHVSPTGQDIRILPGKVFPNLCTVSTRPCKTINWAVQLAQSGDLVSVGGGTYVETITVPKSLTIQGAGALNFGAGVQPPTVVDGNKQGIVFTIQSGVTVSIKGMSIINGKGKGAQQGGGISNNGTLHLTGVILGVNEAAGEGGGIFNKGTLVLNRAWLYRNKSGAGGGGLFSDGSATLNEVNIQENEAQSGGGGINAANSLDVSNSAITNNAGGGVTINGTMTLLNVTISGNIDPVTGHASGLQIMGGGSTLRYVTITANGKSDNVRTGIFKTAASGVQIHNSIVSGNGKNPQCGSLQDTVTTPFTDGGFNIFGDESCLGTSVGAGSTSIIADPKLDALSYNGGFFGLTHALKPGSLAIDLVPQDKCTPTDQRGVARPIDGDGDGKLQCDVGAFEFKP